MDERHIKPIGEREVGQTQETEKLDFVTKEDKVTSEAAAVVLKGYQRIAKDPKFAAKYAELPSSKSQLYHEIITKIRADIGSGKLELTNKYKLAEKAYPDLFNDLFIKHKADKAQKSTYVKKAPTPDQQKVQQFVRESVNKGRSFLINTADHYLQKFAMQAAEKTQPAPVVEAEAVEIAETATGNGVARFFRGMQLDKISYLQVVPNNDPCAKGLNSCAQEFKLPAQIDGAPIEYVVLKDSQNGGVVFCELIEDDKGPPNIAGKHKVLQEIHRYRDADKNKPFEPPVLNSYAQLGITPKFIHFVDIETTPFLDIELRPNEADDMLEEQLASSEEPANIDDI